MSRRSLSSLLSLCASVCLSVCLSAAVTACSSDGGGGGGGGPDGSPVDHPDAMDPCAGPVPTFSQVSLFDVCTTCHSSQLSGGARQNAPQGIDYDTYQAAVNNAAQGVSAVMAGVMPLRGSVTQQQKLDFYTWAACDEPQ